MPSQKRKANGHVCECFKAHETKDECEKQALVNEREDCGAKHRAITAQVILYSETVEVLAGNEDKQTFIVHRDLLALHSAYFLDLFKDKGRGVDKQILISMKPSLFADFVSWVYFGEFLKVENDALEGAASVDDLWEWGRVFKAPAFQNFCMDDCRAYCKSSDTNPTKNPWPFINGIKQMYSTTPKESQLRKLAVNSLSYKNPLHKYRKGSAAWKEWKALLTGQDSQEAWINDLREDFSLEAGKDWKKIPPWDDQHRNDYMEKEIALEDRWDAQILARPIAAIKSAALAKTDVRSIIEWAHLQRGVKSEQE